jgi:hypothetical protein
LSVFLYRHEYGCNGFGFWYPPLRYTNVDIASFVARLVVDDSGESIQQLNQGLLVFEFIADNDFGAEEGLQLFTPWGQLLFRRFRYSKSADDFINAVTKFWRAMGFLPSPANALYFAGQMQPLQNLLEQMESGTLEDIDVLIEITNCGIRAFTAETPSRMKSLTLNGRGAQLTLRYNMLGCIDDLDRAIEVIEEALRYEEDGPFKLEISINYCK